MSLKRLKSGARSACTKARPLKGPRAFRAQSGALCTNRTNVHSCSFVHFVHDREVRKPFQCRTLTGSLPANPQRPVTSQSPPPSAYNRRPADIGDLPRLGAP